MTGWAVRVMARIGCPFDDLGTVRLPVDTWVGHELSGVPHDAIGELLFKLVEEFNDGAGSNDSSLLFLWRTRCGRTSCGSRRRRRRSTISRRSAGRRAELIRPTLCPCPIRVGAQLCPGDFFSLFREV